jgi:hypothetical protein
MIRERGNWVLYRARFGLLDDDEVDLHFGRRDPAWKRYDEVMADVELRVRESLRRAQEGERPYVMFVHGYSTSRPGQTTARSVVRGFMRSPEATPFIVRSECIQHPTVFVAKIKPRATNAGDGPELDAITTGRAECNA